MTQLFKVKDLVTVLPTHPPGHRRTPYYCRGKTGCIERVCGKYPNPEELAYGFSGYPLKWLYRVRFRQMDIWNEYVGPVSDTIDVDLYEHWLEPKNKEFY